MLFLQIFRQSYKIFMRFVDTPDQFKSFLYLEAYCPPSIFPIKHHFSLFNKCLLNDMSTFYTRKYIELPYFCIVKMNNIELFDNVDLELSIYFLPFHCTYLNRINMKYLSIFAPFVFLNSVYSS